MIEVDGISKSFGAVRALDGVELQGRGRPHHGAARAERRRQVDVPAHPLDGARSRTPARRASAASILRPPRSRRAACSACCRTARASISSSRAARTSSTTAACTGSPRSALAARVDALIARLELGAIANRKAKGFSQGERTKIALARALVHDPQHLLLDEPTNGLDVMATRHLRDWLRELRAQGRCVLLSSHVMQEVEALVDDLVIIAAGRVTLTGSPAELAQRFPGRSLEEIFVEAVRGAERSAA